MAYDTGLEGRIDAAIASWGVNTQKKKLFGGIGYLYNGNMMFGIHGDELIVRVSELDTQTLMQHTGVRPFALGGMVAKKNWLFVSGEAIADNAALDGWLLLGREFASSLPPKQ